MRFPKIDISFLAFCIPTCHADGTEFEADNPLDCQDQGGTWHVNTLRHWQLFISDGTLAAPQVFVPENSITRISQNTVVSD